MISYFFFNYIHLILIHCLSTCFCNQHPVNLLLHCFLCIFIEMITDNIDCLPDFLCKCVTLCCCIHHFFHNHFSFFFGVPAESHSIGLCQNIILSIRPKMDTSSFVGYLYIAFSFLLAKSLVTTALFYRKKRFNMMQPTTRSIPNKYHCLSLLFSLPISLINA